MVRGSQNQMGEYHKVVHIWIRNPKGQYLIQKRNKATDRFPYQWAPTAGAVIQGEDPIDAAIRESKEEIGLHIKPEQLKHLKRYFVDHKKANYVIELFLAEIDIDLSILHMDPVEVQAIQMASMEEIKSLYRHQEFWSFDDIDKDYLDRLERS